MQKYKQVFIRQFDRTLERWRASGKTVAETEVYRLLHSIKGTAATIGLQEWTDEAALLLKHMNEEGGSELSFADIMRVIAPIVRLRADAADSDFGRSTDEIADGGAGESTNRYADNRGNTNECDDRYADS
ncbi:Hpt domain-containing protein [Paenibacillus hemerocallicola]|uniref:Hpt domain-containing protein n=1 Tax=Paenibacillus hemerocallicola TaxID=1172614 RepID=A0A5C4T783_9BACL|nr:Hpt domain-containing protein [Paenibacillus hemerocallicola]TNJ64237.1 Hpt domain-containing protein [Paenibacillus hemerocallicola]